MSSNNHLSFFKKNIFLLVILNLIVKPVYILFIEAQVQNCVGSNEYGLYFGILNFGILFNMILDPGLHNYNSKEIAQNRNKASELFGVIFGSKVLLIVFFLAVLNLGGLIIGYPSHYFPVLWSVGFILILSSLNIYLRGHFSALGEYRKEVYFSAVDKTLLIVILAWFLYYQKIMSIKIFLNAQIFALAFTALLIGVFLSQKMKFTFQISLVNLQSILKKTFPYALVMLLMSIYTRIDGVMLERLVNDNALSAGIYAAGFRLMDAANMIGILFSLLLLPMFANLISERKPILDLFHSSASILIVLSFTISIISWFYADDIIYLLYTHATYEYVRVFRYLMLAFLASVNSTILGSIFLASGKLKNINYLFAFGLMLNVCLNFYLIPIHQAFGAVIATLITQIIMFFGMFLIARRLFNVNYRAFVVYKSILLCLILLAASYLISTFSSFSWFIQVIFIVFILAVLSFFSGLLRSEIVNTNR